MGGDLQVRYGWVSAAVLWVERCDHPQLCIASMVILSLHSREMDVRTAVHPGGSLYSLDIVRLWLVLFRGTGNGCGGTVLPEAYGEEPAGKVGWEYGRAFC